MTDEELKGSAMETAVCFRGRGLGSPLPFVVWEATGSGYCKMEPVMSSAFLSRKGAS